jgi:NAD(P)-dependent dehydrogenase (short-subunit alcohol dehydrogenase family)
MAFAKKYTTKLAGTNVLVIGGTSGLGFGLAEALVEHDVAHLFLSSSSEAKISKSIDRLKTAYPDNKTSIKGLVCNLADEATLESNVEKLFAQIDGKLDHIVFTAGDALAPSPLSDVTLASAKKCGMVRFFAPIFVAKYGVPHINPGPASSITLTTGSAAEKPHSNWTVVSSFASGLFGMTRGLALDLKPLRVNLVSPGAVDTELWDGSYDAETKAAALKEFGKRMATGVAGSVEDVVESYLYAMKDKNVTGTVIRTDGGVFIM